MKTLYKIPTDPVVLAYAAGFFDGEGCVLIAKPYNKKSNRRYHRLDVDIAQKDPRPLFWLHAHFGGRIGKAPSQLRKGAMHWILHDQAAGNFLEAIRPYLVLKGEQADIALLFRATVSKRGLGNTRMFGGWGKTAFQHPSPVNEALEIKRDLLREQLSNLKVVK